MCNAKLQFPNITKSNIFVINCSNEFQDCTKVNLFLLYSPFNQNMALATESELKEYDNLLGKNQTLPADFMSLINNENTENQLYRISQISQIKKISILPTNKCNFKCSYCYSVEGRGSEVITQDKINTILEYFINPNNRTSKDLTFSYLGGGEPFLSWDIFKHSLKYSADLAKQHGFSIMNSVNTNGSILSEEIISYLLKYDVTVCVTFEVFENIQNKQRGSWSTVRGNIKKMLDEGVKVILSTIITPDSVALLPELIKEVVTEYKGIKTIIAEPVVDMTSKSFETLEDIALFYNQYTDSFFAANVIAEEANVRLLNSVIRKLWINHVRFCDGEISVTPDAKISGCTSVSSSKETLFSKYNYGEICENGKVNIDFNKLQKLIDTNVYTYKKCTDCFLKWHCCGGCQFRNELYTEVQLDVICIFNREFATKYLLDILEHNILTETNQYLKDIIANLA